MPVSIGALVGVTERDAGVASGLIDSSQQLGGAIGIAVASTVAVSHSRLLLGHGNTVTDALTSGFHWALWVCGLLGLTAVPSRFDDTLLRDHLIDEFRLWLVPVVAGAGQRLFEDVDTSGLRLKLIDERRLENGSVILTYEPR